MSIIDLWNDQIDMMFWLLAEARWFAEAYQDAHQGTGPSSLVYDLISSYGRYPQLPWMVDV